MIDTDMFKENNREKFVWIFWNSRYFLLAVLILSGLFMASRHSFLPTVDHCPIDSSLILFDRSLLYPQTHSTFPSAHCIGNPQFWADFILLLLAYFSNMFYRTCRTYLLQDNQRICDLSDSGVISS